MRYSNDYKLDVASITKEDFHQYLKNIINGVEQPPLHIASLKDGVQSDEYPISISETNTGKVQIAIVETFVPDEMQAEWDEKLEGNPNIEVLAPLVMADSSFDAKYDPRDLLDKPFDELMTELEKEYRLEMDFNTLLKDKGGLIEACWELEDEILTAVGDNHDILVNSQNRDVREFAARQGFGLDILACDENEDVLTAVQEYLVDNAEKTFFDFTNTIDTNEDVDIGTDTDTNKNKEYVDFVLYLSDAQYQALYERAPFEEDFKNKYTFDAISKNADAWMNCYAVLYKDKQAEIEFVVNGENEIGWRSTTIELTDAEQKSLLAEMHKVSKVLEFSIAEFLNELPDPVTYNFKEAQKNGTFDKWQESRKQNEACAKAIIDNINKYFRDNRFDAETAIDEIRHQFSDKRIEKVLAHEIFHYENDLTDFQNTRHYFDGRFSKQALEWAASIAGNFEEKEAHNYDGCSAIKDRTHAVLLNSFIESYMKEKELEKEQTEQKHKPAKAQSKQQSERC